MKTIQINQCTQEELEWLPGVGAKTAEKVIKARPVKDVGELQQLIPPSAWLKIQEADVEFAFGTDEEEAAPTAEFAENLEQLAGLLNLGHLSEEEATAFRKRWLEQSLQLAEAASWKEIPILSEPPLILQEPEPMTLRRVLPGQELKAGAEYVCIWNMRWAPDGQAVTPADAPIQKEITEQLAKYGISIAFVHYGASVRVHTPSRGRVPLVLFEIIRDTEEAESGEEDTRNHQRDGQGD